jgi:ribonuclease HI
MTTKIRIRWRASDKCATKDLSGHWPLLAAYYQELKRQSGIPEFRSSERRSSPQATPEHQVHYYVDGSWTPKEGGGYGIFCSHLQRPELDYVIGVRLTGPCTNNIAELSAIIRVLEEISASGAKAGAVRILSDSTYAVGVITGRLHAKANLALVDRGRRLLQGLPVRVDWQHVRAHTAQQDLDSLGNAIADQLAKGDLRPDILGAAQIV